MGMLRSTVLGFSAAATMLLAATQPALGNGESAPDPKPAVPESTPVSKGSGGWGGNSSPPPESTPVSKGSGGWLDGGYLPDGVTTGDVVLGLSLLAGAALLIAKRKTVWRITSRLFPRLAYQ